MTHSNEPTLIEQAFAAALDRPAEERERLVRDLLPDPAARAEVHRLLARHTALEASGQTFLDGFDAATAGALLEAGTALPETIGRYRVERQLARGGNGVVYLAHDPDLDRPVAIKVLRPDRLGSRAARDRLQTEARASSALDHPHIATIYEIGQTESGDLFIAMAFYEGETLRARLARGALPVADAVHIGGELADALAAAHAKGIVHRDVKPENVLLTARGVRLLDFGIAASAQHADRLTGAAGTLAYMSPEQSQGAPPNPQTDVWALGVVLYELLTGRRPFTGETPDDLLVAIRSMDPVPIRRLRPEVPEAIARAVQACLVKDPTRRPWGGVSVRQVLARPRNRRRATAGAVVAFMGVATAAAMLIPERKLAPAEGSIAVLPFANLSTDPQQEYLSEGITEELGTRLAKVEGLHVAAQTVASRFKGKAADVRAVGRALGVATVLQGSVRRDGGTVRITAQLIDAAKGYYLWSQTYDREPRDLLAIQDEISQAIVSALRIRLPRSGIARARSTQDPEAYELYLKGRYFWNQRTEDALVRATGYFHQAIARDSGYADAYSGLADIEIAPRAGCPVERFARAKVAASKALALDSLLPEAHLSMGWVAMWYDRDWTNADRHLQRAIALRPDYIWAYSWRAAYLAGVGRGEESLETIQHAHALDPLSYVHSTYVGAHLLWLHREREASVYFRKALELAPEYFMAHWGLGRVYLLEGRYQEALAEFAYDGGDFTGLHEAGLIGYAHALAGHAGEARRILRRFQDEGRSGVYVPAINPAIIHIALGEHDQALDWLERLEEERGARTFFIDPIFDPVRTEPRFQQLLQRLGLEPARFGS